MHGYTHAHTSTRVQYSWTHKANWATALINNWVIEGIHYTVCAVITSHLLLCPYLDLWTHSSLMPTGHPGPTPHRLPLYTHPLHQLCKSVCVSLFLCVYVFTCLPAEAQLCLNATTECQSISVLPVNPHSRFAVLCRHRLLNECDDRYVVFV